VSNFRPHSPRGSTRVSNVDFFVFLTVKRVKALIFKNEQDLFGKKLRLKIKAVAGDIGTGAASS
jgi:hypothetical protein